MKKTIILTPATFVIAIGLIICQTVSCKNHSAAVAADDGAVVKDSVTRMAANISKDLSVKGPLAWLDYFENDPGFFMASGGRIAFGNYNSAKTFVRDSLPKMMTGITLHWKNVKVDPLSNSFAVMGADFHEDIVMSGGAAMGVDGYFTAVAHFDGTSWRLRNLNWAIKPGK